MEIGGQERVEKDEDGFMGEFILKRVELAKEKVGICSYMNES